MTSSCIEMTALDMRDQAIDLARRGFRVFKLSATGKPIKERWPEDATDDETLAQLLWTDPVGESCFDNIGICCGRGLIVLDADVKGGKRGLETYAALGLPATLTADTPSGGKHFFFRLPDGVYARNGVENLLGKEDTTGKGVDTPGNGLDLKGDRGFVVAAGSIKAGGSYRWANALPIAEAPDWLVSRVKGDAKAPSSGIPVSEVDDQHALERANEYLSLADAAVEGAGGRRLSMTIAHTLLDFGLTPYTAADVMAEHEWNGRNEPPWEPDDLAKFVDSLVSSRRSPIGASWRPGPWDAFEVIAEAPSATRMRPVTSLVARPLPKREWLVERMLARTFVCGLVSAGGVGKTSFVCALALSLATGNSAMCGLSIAGKTGVWYLNNEDDQDELDRRLKAVGLRHGMADSDLGGRLFVDSGVGSPFMLSVRRGEALVEGPEVADMVAKVRANNIGVVILDPLVEFHESEENDNRAMKAVWAVARRIAVEGNCAVLVPAHSRKPGNASNEGHAGNQDSLRGASSQGGVVRMMFTLDNMSEKDAKLYGIRDDRRMFYARLDDAKRNLGAPGESTKWLERHGQDIGGEEIGVLVPVELNRRVSTKVDIVHLLAEAVKTRDRQSLADVIRSLDAAVIPSFGVDAKWSRTVKAAFQGAGAETISADEMTVPTTGGHLHLLSGIGRIGTLIWKEDR